MAQRETGGAGDEHINRLAMSTGGSLHSTTAKLSLASLGPSDVYSTIAGGGGAVCDLSSSRMRPLSRSRRDLSDASGEFAVTLQEQLKLSK